MRLLRRKIVDNWKQKHRTTNNYVFRFNEYLPPKKNLFVAFTNMNRIIGNQQIIMSISIWNWSLTRRRSVGEEIKIAITHHRAHGHRVIDFFLYDDQQQKNYRILRLIFTSTSWSETKKSTKIAKSKQLSERNDQEEEVEMFNNINWICYVNRIVGFYYLL